MQNVLLLTGRVVAGVAGGLLIYSAFFLYESEEGKLQNALERAWQRIRGLQEKAISREAAFLKIVADVTAKGFAKLFGERLFGPKAFAASIAYSTAAITVCVAVIAALSSDETDVLFALACGGLIVFFLLIASLGPFIHREWIKLAWLLSVILSVAGIICILTVNMNAGGLLFSILGVSLPLAALSDFLFIAFNRITLIRAAKSNSFLAILGYSIGSLVLAFLLFFVPMWLSVKFQARREPFLGLLPQIGLPEVPLMALGFANLFDVLVSLAWILVALIMLIDRILWPLVLRPLYALDRYKVFIKQKKLVLGCGIALLGFSIPKVGHTLGAIVDALQA